jgi:Tfp pilus assembly protein PilO
MNSRTITASVLTGVLVIALWWMFVFSGIRSDASDVDGEIDAAKSEALGLETQLQQLEDLEATAPETEARLNELRKAVPAQPELGTFIDSANALGDATGVRWVSVSPAPPTDATTAGTIQFTMVVEGGYFQVLDYLNRVETMDRLVVVDGITVTEGGTEGAEAAGPPSLTATLTARMFSQASAPAGAGATTTPEVAGGGGVAATSSGTQES